MEWDHRGEAGGEAEGEEGRERRVPKVTLFKKNPRSATAMYVGTSGYMYTWAWLCRILGLENPESSHFLGTPAKSNSGQISSRFAGFGRCQCRCGMLS